jgi:hypothetical protein
VDVLNAKFGEQDTKSRHLGNGYDKVPASLYGREVEFSAYHLTDPVVRDPRVILATMPFDEGRRNRVDGHWNGTSLDEVSNYLKELRFQLEASSCYHCGLVVLRHALELLAKLVINDDALQGYENLIEPWLECLVAKVRIDYCTPEVREAI